MEMCRTNRIREHGQRDRKKKEKLRKMKKKEKGNENEGYKISQKKSN
jgi:hypothetical protein